MCAVFGFVNYRSKLSKKHLKELVKTLAVKSEVRGKDASGIAYVRNGKIKIFKRPKPAHKMNFFVPAQIKILSGHTRMTTQGNPKYNYNNHPFKGKTSDGEFALCHNGVLYNDDALAKAENLPSTIIKTDSYTAVQLIEKYGHLNFDTISKMSEAVCGSFVFTILSSDNDLYISKGDNPLCLIHFAELGLYVYTSTSEIMKEVITGSFLKKHKAELINVNEGEIIKIDSNGILSKGNFIPDMGSFYGYCRKSYDNSGSFGYLYDICNMFGLNQDDLLMLYDMGYCDEEIEMMLDDKELLQSCLNEARYYMKEYNYTYE
ncbi:MAG: glucosamine--fructose-6-phosphate aminotransferase [Hominimerdicola sp.]